MTPAISLRGIGKKYRISPSRSSRLGEILSFGKAKRSHEFWALQDFNLDVEPGTTLGVVGRNGGARDGVPTASADWHRATSSWWSTCCGSRRR